MDQEVIKEKNPALGGEEAGSGEDRRRAAILVVDDEDDVRTVLRLMLTHAGYDVREAEDGEIALRRIEQEPPDLILLDVLMPGMDGFEVCRRVRENPQTANIPVIILSARKDSRSRQEGFRAGATKYLTKPLAPDQLIWHVSDTLKRKSE